MDTYIIVDLARRLMCEDEFYEWVGERDLWSYTDFPDNDKENE